MNSERTLDTRRQQLELMKRRRGEDRKYYAQNLARLHDRLEKKKQEFSRQFDERRNEYV